MKVNYNLVVLSVLKMKNRTKIDRTTGNNIIYVQERTDEF